MVGGVPGSTIMDDVAINKISVTLHRFGLDIAKERLIDFLRDIGQENTIHPLRMIFDELETRWDGQTRLAMWLHNFCGVEDNEYTRYVARALADDAGAPYPPAWLRFQVHPRLRGQAGHRKDALRQNAGV